MYNRGTKLYTMVGNRIRVCYVADYYNDIYKVSFSNGKVIEITESKLFETKTDLINNLYE
jgi:hypothetical protein